MKERQTIQRGIGTYEGSGIYEERDGNHRCVKCNKKLRAGQRVIEEISPSSRGYRRNEISYWHEVCPK